MSVSTTSFITSQRVFIISVLGLLTYVHGLELQTAVQTTVGKLVMLIGIIGLTFLDKVAGLALATFYIALSYSDLYEGFVSEGRLDETEIDTKNLDPSKVTVKAIIQGSFCKNGQLIPGKTLPMLLKANNCTNPCDDKCSFSTTDGQELLHIETLLKSKPAMSLPVFASA